MAETLLAEKPTYAPIGDRFVSFSPEFAQDLTDVQVTLLAMDSLAVSIDTEFGTEIYDEAAYPGYRSSFTRDSAVANSLRGDPEVLENRLEFSLRRIGDVQNPITGQEPGKPHHELPDVISASGLSTAYNACDTAAEVLRAISALAERGKTDLIDKYPEKIEQMVGYIKRHVNANGLFIEDPAFSGNKEPDGRNRKFGLKVTYWKDSELNRHGSREPHYPIVYTLAHFQNARALERFGQVMGDERLTRYGRYMTEAGLQYLWNQDHFVTAIDQDGVVDSPNSDSLHALLYITPSNLPAGYAQKVEQYMKILETDAGYRSGIPVSQDVDDYHMGVWTHEQAQLHAAAELQNLGHAQEVTRLILPFIDPKKDFFPEVLDAQNFSPTGNKKQLWAIGAYLYFQNPKAALL